MGRYSGILLCSDFDGTFYVDKTIPEDNIKAVKHFRDNGGRFTIASGRHVEFLTNAIKDVDISAPLIHLNGALIYDRDNGMIIKERFMSGMTKTLVLRLAKEVPDAVRIAFFLKDGATRIPVGEIDSMPEKYARETYKLVVHLESADPARSNTAVSVIKELVGEDLVVARSSWGYVEILDPKLTKSRATHYLKDYLGADTLVCVGDFENDLDMVRDADIGYAVANAADCLKNVADRVTASARDGAIARIIEEL
jgi:HAD superfamily hydrolase (TIGR01484 family)